MLVSLSDICTSYKTKHGFCKVAHVAIIVWPYYVQCHNGPLACYGIGNLLSSSTTWSVTGGLISQCSLLNDIRLKGALQS